MKAGDWLSRISAFFDFLASFHYEKSNIDLLLSLLIILLVVILDPMFLLHPL
jgi:hypothetical protein